jgi:thymidylate synthase (FAD)
MKVQLLSSTMQPEKVVATAAKTCYSPGTTEMLWKNECKYEEFIQNLRSMGHMSPFEHASFTFGIDGVSRVLLAQLTRHRIASFSVQSQRYVKYDIGNKDPSNVFTVPEAISSGPDHIFENYTEALDEIGLAYENLVSYLEAEGFSKTEAAENARYILPGSMKTNLVMTMNARELMHFFSLRCCNRAQAEIRDLAWTILRLLYDKFPAIFTNCGPNCLVSKCGEGKMSCGKPYQKGLFD